MPNHLFLICSNQTLLDSLTATITTTGWQLTGTATDAEQARSQLQYLEADILLLVSPIGSETGDRLAKDLCYIKPTSGLIIAASAEKMPLFEKRLGDAMCFLIAKPISKASLLQALTHMQQALTVLTLSRQKYAQLERKLDDLRVIGRAKNILISNLHMTEQQAHSYIQKQSMDMQLSPRKVAEGILNTYEI